MKTVSEPFYDSYEALLSDPRVDAVAIGDYYGIRGRRIIDALKAGKSVLCDKPLCTSLEELESIRTLAVERNLKVCCLLDLRYDPAVNAARSIVRSGRLGPIHAMSFTGQHPLNYGTRPGWYFEKGKHGGTINDIAIHGIDALRFITGLEYERTVCARTWNAFAVQEPDFRDCAQFMAQFTGQAGVIADVSYAAQSKTAWIMPSYWRFTLWGADGCLEFRAGDGKVLLACQDSDRIEEIPAGPVGTNWLADFMTQSDLTLTLDELASAEAVLKIQRCADSNNQKGQ